MPVPSNPYLDAVHTDTFLYRYMAWNHAIETPTAYDFWCGLFLLSAAVGRRLVVTRPHAPVFLNLYAVLCSDAGVTRKSTAVRRAEEVYRAAGLDEQHYTVTSSVTPEKMFAETALRSTRTGVGSCCILVSELITLLGREHYAAAMPGLLTDWYDCPSIRTSDRLGTGTTTVRNAFVSFLAASTPAWLVRAINPDVIEGGFTSRTLFVIEEKPKRRVAWPVTDDTAGSRVADLVSDLATVGADADRYAAEGITLTSAALTHFTQWYERRHVGTASLFLNSFEAREDHHVLRIAALLSVNERRYQIQPGHIAHAIKIVARVRDAAAALFGEGTGNRRLVSGVDRLRTTLAEAGEAGISKSALIFKVRRHIAGRELDYALATMHELRMVDMFEEQGARGRATTIWRATRGIVARDAVVLLNERLTA